MTTAEMLKVSSDGIGKSGLHLAINFDIRDDILNIISELGGYGGGYEDTIKLAEAKMTEDPEGIFDMLSTTVEIARMAENPDSMLDQN